ncbi:ABC transporter substrate-binding protein [Methanoplanus limicola]|uniref:ABC-type transporter, periplasmic subunit n=1 Tax=Methanoplanus limicola DSM 2279 TaxID=937775 RepID=H1Z425_9EURY|nr:ABC transporter substrate-binding protein [Methanoplanus limicola]EHQ35704.1 ABC-type transporter, periplasmic subunit [Methanoplanus limicola DSM 2279]
MNCIRAILITAFITLIMSCSVHGVMAVASVLPEDTDNNGVISENEISRAILNYLSDKYSVNNGTGSPDYSLADGVYIYNHWDGMPKTVADTSGQEITLYKPIRKAVIMNSEILETLRSLDYDDEKIAGVGKYILEDDIFFPEYADLPNVGSVWSSDTEKIISLEPDSVFIYADFMKDKSDEIQENIQSLNPDIRVFRFDLFNPENYADEVRLLSVIADREEEGEEFAEFYEKQMNTVQDIADLIPEDEKVRVYFESWDDYKSCAEGSGYDEKITIAGGKNIFSNATPEYPVVNPESILFGSPEIIVKLTGSGKLAFGGYADDDNSKTLQVYNDLKSRTGWSTLPAVKDNRFHIINNDIFGGPEHFIGILYLAKWFYPEKFSDIDPQEIHQKYLSDFQGLDYDLNEHGVFVSP